MAHLSPPPSPPIQYQFSNLGQLKSPTLSASPPLLSSTQSQHESSQRSAFNSVLAAQKWNNRGKSHSIPFLKVQSYAFTN